jgi:hypothetical protein
VVRESGASEDIGQRIGATVRATRRVVGWSERELAVRLGTSQSAIRRLEAGGQRFVDVRLASVALALLGIRMKLDGSTLGLAGRREQRDLVHARCCGHVARRLGGLGWEVKQEVEVGTGRYRGWIDLLAYRAADRCLFCGEIKTEIDDVGRISAHAELVRTRSLGRCTPLRLAAAQGLFGPACSLFERKRRACEQQPRDARPIVSGSSGRPERLVLESRERRAGPRHRDDRPADATGRLAATDDV